MVLSETGHTLHFSSDYTEVKLCAFGRSTLAEVVPMALNDILIKFSNLANGKMKLYYVCCVIFARFEDRLIENGFHYIEFAH